MAVNYQPISMNGFAKLLAKNAWDSIYTGPYWILFLFYHWGFKSSVDSRLHLVGELPDHWWSRLVSLYGANTLAWSLSKGCLQTICSRINWDPWTLPEFLLRISVGGNGYLEDTSADSHASNIETIVLLTCLQFLKVHHLKHIGLTNYNSFVLALSVQIRYLMNLEIAKYGNSKMYLSFAKIASTKCLHKMKWSCLEESYRSSRS